MTTKCTHGNPAGARVFCRHPAVAKNQAYVTVSPSRCRVCPHFSPSPAGVRLPSLTQCVLRNDVPEKIPANCGCKGVKTLDLYQCGMHGDCARDASTRERLVETFKANREPRKIKGCHTCSDKWTPDMEQTEVLFAFFNPLGLASRWDNLSRWWGSLGAYQKIARGVHLVYSDNEPEVPNCVRIKATPGQVYFIKEPLLNWLLERTTAYYACWTDTDIVWSDPRWLMYAVRLLREWDGIQCFTELLENGEPYYRAAASTDNGTGAPGGAWVMRKDHIGEMPLGVVGGGDEYLHARWRSAGYRLAALPMTAYHLRHGDKKDRQYHKRHEILAGFDPAVHMRIADNGLPEITDTEYLRRVREYFESRNEDSR